MSDAEKKLDLLPIMSPLFNLREVCKQMSLLEDHLNNPRKRCHDCIRKHFLTIEALFEEAISLDKDFKYGKHLDGKAHDIRELQTFWIDSKEKKNHDREYLEIAQTLRGMRKGFAPLCFDVRKMASLERLEGVCTHKRFASTGREAAFNREAFLSKFLRNLPVIGGLIRLLSDGRDINTIVGEMLLTKRKELFERLYNKMSLVLVENDLEKAAQKAKDEILEELKPYALDIDRSQVPAFKQFLKAFVRRSLLKDMTENTTHEKTMDSAWDTFKQMITLKVKQGDEVRFPFFPKKGQVLVAHDPRNLIFSLVPADYLLQPDTDFGNYVVLEKKKIGLVGAVAFTSGFETLLTLFNPGALKQVDVQAGLPSMRKTSSVREGSIFKSILRQFEWGKFILGFLAEHRPSRVVINEAAKSIIQEFYKNFYKQNITTPKAASSFIESRLKGLSKAFLEWSVDTAENSAVKDDYKTASHKVLALTSELLSKLENPAHETAMSGAFNTLTQFISRQVKEGDELVFSFFPKKPTQTLIATSLSENTFGVVGKDYLLESSLDIDFEVQLKLVPFKDGVPAHVQVVDEKDRVYAIVTDPKGLGNPMLLGSSDFNMDTKQRLASLIKRATLSQTEREDKKIADLVRPHPKNKPPRDDLRNRSITSKDDPDFQGVSGGHKGDRDLSMKSEKAASVHRVMMRLADKKKV